MDGSDVIHKWAWVAIPVHHLAKSIDWYIHNLACQLCSYNYDHACLILHADQPMIRLVDCRGLPNTPAPQPTACFWSSNLHDLHSRLVQGRAHIVTFAEHELIVTDNSNNLLSFAESK